MSEKSLAELDKALASRFGGYASFKTAVYAFRNQADFMLANLANLNIRPISFREYYYDAFFRDLAHLEAYLKQIPAIISNWRLGAKPYQPEIDRAVLELYARYNQTPRGIRLLRHRIIFIGRKEPVHFYPIEGA